MKKYMVKYKENKDILLIRFILGIILIPVIAFLMIFYFIGFLSLMFKSGKRVVQRERDIFRNFPPGV